MRALWTDLSARTTEMTLSIVFALLLGYIYIKIKAVVVVVSYCFVFLFLFICASLGFGKIVVHGSGGIACHLFSVLWLSSLSRCPGGFGH